MLRNAVARLHAAINSPGIGPYLNLLLQNGESSDTNGIAGVGVQLVAVDRSAGL